MRKNKLRVPGGLALLVLFFAVLGLAVKNYDLDALNAKVSPNVVTVTVEVTVQPSLPPAESEEPAEPTPEPTPTVDPDSPEGRAAAMGLPAPPDVDIESWEFILANPTHSIEEYAPPELVEMEGQKFDSRIIDPMKEFVQAARGEGLSVYLSSGYRDYDEQNYYYNRKIGQGYTPEQAATIVAPPGTSEHQTGLVCDITDRYYDPKDFTLENTALFKWMSVHCQEYGFIVRYPRGKAGLSTEEALASVTGIIYEPWHFRYVGVEPAKYIMENGICLEEFISLYKDISPVVTEQD